MARVKGGTVTRARRKKVLKRAEGYFGSKHRLYKTAQEQLFHSGAYSYNDRKKRKGDFRKLWITRINAAARSNDISYSQLISGLNKAGVSINRKMLSELAISDSKEFTNIVNIAKEGLKNPLPKKEEIKEEVKKVVKKETKTVTDLTTLTVADLKKLAKEKNVEGYTTMKKAELLSALK